MKNFILLFLIIFASQNIFGQNGWIAQNSGVNNKLSMLQIIDSSNLFVNTDSAYILKTTNGGILWSKVLTGIKFNTISFINASTGFGTKNNIVYKTTNAGQNWFAVNSDTLNTSFSYLDLKFTNISTGFASQTTDGRRFFAKTVNGGVHWDTIKNCVYSGHLYEWISYMQVLDSANIYYSFLHVFDFSPGGTTFESQYYHSTNAGQNFDLAGTLSIKYASFYTPDKGYAFNAFFNPAALHKTTDGGNTWTQVSINTADAITVLSDSVLFLFSPSNASYFLHKSTDGGMTFVIDNTLIPSDIKFLNRKIGYLIGYHGEIYRTGNGGGTVDIKTTSTIPNKYSLFQNYPNPFNPSTKINYELKSSGFVSLKVFDLLGKEVASLVNEKQSAGSYAVDFNLAEYNLPSGIYFYTLNTGEFKETRKMVLLK
jgi:photosystem II stability/assembly factor-like uncharacterized protein